MYAVVAAALGLPALARGGVGTFPAPALRELATQAPPAYQAEVAAKVRGPRKLAAARDGGLYVLDAEAQLHRLTARGERVGALFQGATAVASGAGLVFVGTRSGVVVQLDERTGRVVRRMPLGVFDGPVGMAWDEARGVLWMAFGSGVVQARSLDGAVVRTVGGTPAGQVARLVDLALDPAAGIVWVAQDRNTTAPLVHGFDAATGAFVRSVAQPAQAPKVAGGLAVDAAGQVYVSDVYTGEVVVLSREGAAAGKLGGPAASQGGLRRPLGLALAASGDVMVANLDQSRVERFGPSAALPACPGDADCDGLPDAWEAANGLDPADPSNALADRDGDGLNDTEEFLAGTRAGLADSDGDGFSDAEEKAAGFDPLNPDDHTPVLVAQVARSVEPGLVRFQSAVHVPGGEATGCGARWEQVAGPRVALAGAETLSPSFIARKSGYYQFKATPSCRGKAGAAAAVAVAVKNVAPRADGGRLATLPVGAGLSLSAAFSSDANGDDLSFQWDQVLGPATLEAQAGRTASARFFAPGYYVFRVGAADPKGAEDVAEVPVLVLGEQAAPAAVVSTPVVAQAGGQVVLDASASHAGADAVFSFEQVAGAPVGLDVAGARASFSPPAPGRYAFDLTVTENGVRSPPARAEVYAGAGPLPVALASAPALAEVEQPFVLDGAASAGAGLTYAWRQVGGPAAGMADAARARATVVAFEPGSYVFELTVGEGQAVGVPARVRVEVRANGKPIPVAVASAPATAVAGDLVVLDGRESTGAVRRRWTQVAGPWVAVMPVGAAATFRPTVPGTYAFELEVDDGKVRSAPARVAVTVFPNGTEN